MDLQKIKVRKDLERMVINYRTRGDISEDQCVKICHFIDITIGGGNLLRPEQRKERSVIPFPVSYTGPVPENTHKETEEEKAERIARENKLLEIYAPYGEPLPEGVKDFRQVLQRDGLVLICYERFTSMEGAFYNVLWAQSNHVNKRRVTNWSGVVREEEIPHVMPLDAESSYNYHQKKILSYTVTVAPENVLGGPLSDYISYVKSLKAAGIRNSEGVKIDFDYVFNFAAEKRNRFLLKNEELIKLKLPARMIGALNNREIYTAKALKKITIQELRALRNLGEATIKETIALLKEAGITLQEEKRECEEDQGQLLLEF